MAKFTAKSPAKINLSLDIIGSLPNGYHELETIMQTVDLEDELVFDIDQIANSTSKINISCTNEIKPANFPEDDTNLIAKAFHAFLKKMAEPSSIKMTVKANKIIPSEAGLAGGSSNAALTLLVLNKYFNDYFSKSELLNLASELGSDIPFFLEGGTCIGRGRGEKLEKIANICQYTFCLVKPKHISLSTVKAYQAFEAYQGNLQKPNFKKAVKGLTQNKINEAVSAFGNVFEPIVCRDYPLVQEVKNKLLALDVWCCYLTGKGPTLFAIVPNREMAHFVRRKLMNDEDYGFVYSESSPQSEFGPMLDFWICEPVEYGVHILAQKA